MLLFVAFFGCAGPMQESPETIVWVGEFEEAPPIDTGCGMAYKDRTFDLTDEFVQIPGACINKLNDPIVGPRCRSLLDKSLSGYFGEETRLEALRLTGR